RMIAALKAAGLGHIIDTVPNHMSIATRDNRLWWDVLRNGLASPYARYFDVDWEPPEARLRNTVLLPVLADQYGRALERGEIQLHREETAFTVRYKDHVFPVEPRSLAGLLRVAALSIQSERLAFVADTVELLPPPTETSPAGTERRRRDDRVAAELLLQLLREEPKVAEALDRAVAACNADPDSLDRLLEQQNYRLAWWQAAERDLGYRRFFDVNNLIGMRMEVPEAFDEAHQLIFDLVRSGAADGLRIDHVDGIRDPEHYLRLLQERCPTYVVVEKILQDEERLPEEWPVEGTTGYEFLNLVGGLFINPRAEAPLTQFYASFAGVSDRYADVAHDKKLLVLREGLGSDVARLGELLLRICERHRRHRDYTRHMLTEGLRELLACFPVYRTYVRPDRTEIREADRATIDFATNEAKRRRPDLDPEMFDFMRGIMTLEIRGDLEGAFVRRFQQLSSAATAKGVEDTAFYCYNRFVALNEVGGNPARFGISPAQFHARMAEVQDRYPKTMNATATHDTKRGEDVRARLAVISECPAAWTAAVSQWKTHNERHRSGGFPDRNTEYLYYQTLVGAWPLTRERALAYMEKATREAKQLTSWTSPNQEFETALKAFVERTLDDAEFVSSLERFVETILAAGRVVSLAQTLIKLTAPGIPDLYQGTELWSLALVDPDNRRPVDYELRRRLLGEMEITSAEQALARMDEGVPKLWMIQRALRVGAAGCYQPLQAEGEHADHVVAFGRGGQLITVVPRLTQALRGGWGSTALELPNGSWRNVFSDETHRGRQRVDHLLAPFPVALLAREK
ncbi:MAG TPA: malto-oligosyltrehalose synthase, partial [Gemmatimonadales bacterium]|nr:malto-oligosyltrehalose synthase [Gemmatimonadales bacterium]